MRTIHATAAGFVLASVTAAVVLATGGQDQAREQAVPSDVRNAAEAGLVTLLGVEAGKGIDRLGFGSRAEAAGAAIGAGFRVFTVPPDLLLGSDSTDLAALAVPSSQWLFLVVNGASPKSLVTVDLVDGAWTAVSIGGADLSRELAEVLARWPASTHRHRFIRSEQAGAELMEVSRDGRVLGAVPFLSARRSLGAAGRFDANDLWPTSRVVERMRPAVKAAMSQKK